MNRPEIPDWLEGDFEKVEANYASRGGDGVWEVKRFSTTRCILRMFAAVAARLTAIEKRVERLPYEPD